MKTPEQIVEERIAQLDMVGSLTDALTSGWFDGNDVTRWMAEVIEADRAQHEVYLSGAMDRIAAVDPKPETKPQVAWTMRRADQIKPGDVIHDAHAVGIVTRTQVGALGQIIFTDEGGALWGYRPETMVKVQTEPTNHTEARHRRAEIMGVKPHEA